MRLAVIRQRYTPFGGAERFLELCLGDGDAGRTHERQSLSEARAEVGIFPGFDPAVRQTERGIGVDRLGPQIGDPGVTSAGKPLLRRSEQVEIGLLGARLELLDGKLHAVPLGRLAGSILELGVARLFKLERKLGPA